MPQAAAQQARASHRISFSAPWPSNTSSQHLPSLPVGARGQVIFAETDCAVPSATIATKALSIA